eukprot:m.181906 g.181906  ORF g.181906 m.181906 type:complete len:227 (-) comp16876_c0_seq4:4391-5071(-)
MLVLPLLSLILCHGAQTFDYDYGLTLPEELSERRQPMYVDSETKTFLDSCQKRFESFLPTASDVVSLSLLRPFLSTTSVNGLVGRGRMYILSSVQFRKLLTSKQPLPASATLLDIGAGDGGVTQRLQDMFQQVEVTETNTIMRWRLWWNGFRTIHDESSWLNGDHRYTVISCLNVLDRCKNPLQLLQQMYSKLESNGLLLLALVLPYSPFIDDPSTIPNSVSHLSS